MCRTYMSDSDMSDMSDAHMYDTCVYIEIEIECRTYGVVHMRHMTHSYVRHSYVWHDSLIYSTITHTCDMSLSRLYPTRITLWWCIFCISSSCVAVTGAYVWHDSFMNRTRDMSLSCLCRTRIMLWWCIFHLSYSCVAVIDSYVWHDSCMTHARDWHDFVVPLSYTYHVVMMYILFTIKLCRSAWFICLTWLIHDSYVWHKFCHVFVVQVSRCDDIYSMFHKVVWLWLIHVFDMTHPWLMRVTWLCSARVLHVSRCDDVYSIYHKVAWQWLIHVCDMTHSYTSLFRFFVVHVSWCDDLYSVYSSALQYIVFIIVWQCRFYTSSRNTLYAIYYNVIIYGVASTSRLLIIIGFFCKRAL